MPWCWADSVVLLCCSVWGALLSVFKEDQRCPKLKGFVFFPSPISCLRIEIIKQIRALGLDCDALVGGPLP